MSTKRIAPKPCTDFQETVTKFISLCSKLNIAVKDRSDEDDTYCCLSFDNGVMAEIDIDIDIIETIAETIETEKPRFSIGYMKETTSGHWEPSDFDFCSCLETFNIWDAGKKVALLPKEWEIDCMLEGLSWAESEGF